MLVGGSASEEEYAARLLDRTTMTNRLPLSIAVSPVKTHSSWHLKRSGGIVMGDGIFLWCIMRNGQMVRLDIQPFYLDTCDGLRGRFYSVLYPER